jgi:phosphoglycolate phosphatase-like HAD superfamily hydrolase
MSILKAVVFDIDGTLIDTREFILQAYQYAIGKHGYQVPERSQIAALIGRKIEECYAILVPGADPAPLIADHVAFQEQNISLVHPYDGVNELFDTLREMELKVVLWTGRREHVQTVLERCGFDRDSFAAFIDAPMVEKGKPDPEGLLMGLGVADIAPEAAMMVGDAVVDIEAGIRGGVAATVGITHGFGTRNDLVAARPDYIIDSLLELVPIVKVLAQKESTTQFS